MKPGLKLNCHDREINPLFESHDPSLFKDPVSGIYYSYSTDSAITSKYHQGIPIRRSRNLIDFEYVGTALSEEAVHEAGDNGEFPRTEGFWAPFVEYVQGEYRMYYSATKAFGSSESKIWLAVAKHPEGPFENRGVAVDTWFTSDLEPNGIDPHIIDDTEGRKYLVYGSFFGGIYIKELCKDTGLSKDGKEKNQGKRIAYKPENAFIDGPEGAAVIYNADTNYYYLFLSYGWLGENYDIRVGRARKVSGPYLDFHGKDLNGESYGLKLANSYCFESTNAYADKGNDWKFAGFRGPGHGVPFFDIDKKEYFFVHHVRDGADIFRMENKDNINPVSYRMHYMIIRRMYFLEDWPVFSPEPYAGEKAEPLAFGVEVSRLPGIWEQISLKYDDNRIQTGELMNFSNKTGKGIVMRCFDFENSCEGIAVTGLEEGGTAFWAKYKEE